MPNATPADRLAPPPPRAAQGFTLVEVIVATAISALLLLGILALFETNARVTRVQSDIAEMQQAQRVAQNDLVRIVQMTGRGGLQAGALPTGLAVAVRNDVGAAEHIDPTDDSTPEVLEGTDVLTVRGVFNSPIYQVAYRDGANFVFDGGTPAASTYVNITLGNPTNTGLPQDLTPLVEAIDEGRPEALIIVSPLSDQRYAVVELDPGNSDVSGAPATVVLRALLADGESSALYHTLTPGGAFPANLLSVAYVGILEEHRYYVRERRPGGELLATLASARVYPATQDPHAANLQNWEVEIADNVFDLQVAYGVDGGVDGAAGTANDGVIADGAIDGIDRDADEWLYNDPGDDDADAKWNAAPLYYLRLTSLVRSARRDRGYLAPELDLALDQTIVEDHDYTDSPLNAGSERWFRRRALQTVVDMRNL